jgi:hypothetical protein
MTQRIVSIGAVGVLAATFLAACSSDDSDDYDRYCVDTNTGSRIDDRDCDSTTHGHSAWYFVSRGTRIPKIGETRSFPTAT